jgi:PIN domain nuclease of toxin-antitoxin system
MALQTLGRLRLTRHADEWIEEALADGRIRIAELTSTMAIEAGAIPREALADPLDRRSSRRRGGWMQRCSRATPAS